MATHYELMVMVSGGKTDEEVAEISRKITKELAALGCVDLATDILERVRLQYPVRGDRTGVFVRSKFSCDTGVVRHIQDKLRYMAELRRVVIRHRDQRSIGIPRLSHVRERASRQHHAALPTLPTTTLTSEEIERKVAEAIEQVDTPPAG